MSNPVFRFATVQGQAIHWFLGRNCSVTPAQLGWLYLSLCLVTMGIGTFFWFQGAVLVLPFAWLELTVVGVAFLVYARHAADGERISLQGRQLVVELESAGRLERAEFDRDWVRVEPSAADREHILLTERRLVVELENAGRLERAEFNREFVRVEPARDARSLIEVSGQGRRVSVGRYVRPELRPALARELRLALRTG